MTDMKDNTKSNSVLGEYILVGETELYVESMWACVWMCMYSYEEQPTFARIRRIVIGEHFPECVYN